MHRPTVLRLRALVALAVAGLAGCTADSTSVEERARTAFLDAKVRVADSTEEEVRSSTSISIPDGTARLRVRALYVVEGDGSFVLTTPQNNGVKIDSFVRGRSFEGDPWFHVWQPEPGTWKFNVNLPEGGTFAFGFYRE